MDTLAEGARTFLSVVWQQHDDLCHRFEDEIFEFDDMGSLSKLGRTIEDMLEDWERAKGQLNDEINFSWWNQWPNIKDKWMWLKRLREETYQWKSKVRRRSIKSLRSSIRYKRLKMNGITNNNKPTHNEELRQMKRDVHENCLFTDPTVEK